ncbi:hypothetical protein [Pontibacter aydingkolensis]|nr:hypothetical protein [Pontibacter aydingkolensis]
MDYNPALDLLKVEWPPYGSLSVPEFEHALEHLVETLRLYYIPRLLVDARRVTTVADEPDQLDLGIRFLQALEATRVRKVARLVADTASRDVQSRRQAGEKAASYQFQTFARLEVALAWLRD